MAKSLLVLITKAPYGFEEAFAGLRAGLGMLASGQVPVSNALLVGDGTLNAVAAQKPEAVRMPSNVEALNDLMDFEAKVYCREGGPAGPGRGRPPPGGRGADRLGEGPEDHRRA